MKSRYFLIVAISLLMASAQAEQTLTKVQLEMKSYCSDQIAMSADQQEKVVLIRENWAPFELYDHGDGLKGEVVYEHLFTPKCLLPLDHNGQPQGKCAPPEVQTCSTQILCFPNSESDFFIRPKVSPSENIRCNPPLMDLQ